MGDNYELIELCKSGHFYYRGDESQTLEQAILKFVTQFKVDNYIQKASFLKTTPFVCDYLMPTTLNKL